MKLLTAEQMRLADGEAIKTLGIPGSVLMENAGRSVFDLISAVMGDLSGKRFEVFCGPGNNGGDGFVVARYLINSGAKVNIYLLGELDKVRGDAALNHRILKSMGRAVTMIDEDCLSKLKFRLAVADGIVDAIFGTGIKGGVQGIAAEVIEEINSSGKTVFSVDIPSGLDADLGLAEGVVVRATYTVTFAWPKRGLLIYPGAEYAGELYLADIGIPQSVLEKSGFDSTLISCEFVRDLLPKRAPDANKGDCGRVFVLAGSRGMPGAALMASESALRSGAGLVTLGLPEGINQSVSGRVFEVMTLPLAEIEDGTLSGRCIERVMERLKGANAAVIGPGLGLGDEIPEIIAAVLRETDTPSVLDADGLNAIAKLIARGELSLKDTRMPAVMTPHPGEMSRLLGIPIAEITRDRVGCAKRAAKAWQKVVVLKGARTVVAAPDGRVYINPTGNPGMATGGSGDVLSGVIAGLMAQGLSPLDSAIAGTYIHGLAGDMAKERKGEIGMIASDIIEHVPGAFLRVIDGRASFPVNKVVKRA